MKEREDIRLKNFSASLADVKDFMSSAVYADYVLAIEQLIEQQRDDLEDVRGDHSGRTYDFIRGALWSLRQMKEAFRILKDILEDEQKQKEESRR